MKELEKGQRRPSLVWGILVICGGYIGYVIWRQWLFLVGGLVRFILITTFLNRSVTIG